jgi:hypothetical protein
MPFQPILFKEESTQEQRIKTLQILMGCAKRAYGSQGGIIMILARNDNVIQYLEDSSLSDYYWSDFGSETKMEEPITFRSAKRAFVLAEKIQNQIDLMDHRSNKFKGEVHFAIWVHPDAGAPLSKYLKMTTRFPGSPSQ